MREVTIPVTFKIGTLKELGWGGFKQQWISSKHEGAQFELTSGAGLGSSLIEASAKRGDQYVVAEADIRELAQTLFGELERELEGSDGRDDDHVPDGGEPRGEAVDPGN